MGNNLFGSSGSSHTAQESSRQRERRTSRAEEARQISISRQAPTRSSSSRGQLMSGPSFALCSSCQRLIILPPDEHHNPQRRMVCVCGAPVSTLSFGGPLRQQVDTLEILNRLVQQVDLNSNKGASSEILSMLPTHKYSRRARDEKINAGEKIDVDDPQYTCRICFDEYEEGDQLTMLPCFHKYHTKCIEQWLRTSKECPLCQTSVDTLLEQGSGTMGIV